MLSNALNRRMCLAVLMVFVLQSIGHAVQIQPALLEVDQAPATEQTYVLTVHNDSASREELLLYLANWKRLENGEHDWEIPVNGARWILNRSLTAGETTVIRYSVQLPETGPLEIQGVFASATPSLRGEIEEEPLLSEGGASSDSAYQPLRIYRTVESVDASGNATVSLTIRSYADVRNLALYETCNRHAQVVSIDSAGAQFDTIHRSNAAWITLSTDRLVLDPGETQEVRLTVRTPEHGAGTYWSAVIAEMHPQESFQGGSRVFTIMRTAIKVLVTIPGTEIRLGTIDHVAVTRTNPLTLDVGFINTGNVQLNANGEVHVIDRSGATIRTLSISDFKTLPNATRFLTLSEPSDTDPLPAGIYQAVVSLDFGGSTSIVGARGFRVR